MRSISSIISRRRRQVAAGEGGFTMVELMMATMVVMVVLLSMAYVVGGSLSQAGCGRQRNAADSLVNQDLEEIRALSYSTVAAGDNPSNDATFSASADSHISYNSGTGVYTYVPTGETMPTNTGSSIPAPVYPHASTVSENGTTYTVDTYISNFTSGGVSVSGAYRVTAVANWSGGSCEGVARSVSAQTVVQQPSATTSPCLADTTHPYPAPCTASFFSTLNTGSGAISIAPPSGYGGNAIAGLALTQALLSLPTSVCTVQIEQVATDQCTVTGSAESLAITGSTQTSGGDSVSCADSSDPSSSALTCSNSALGQSSLNTLTVGSAGNNQLSLVPGGSTVDSGSVVDTTSASTNPACKDLSATPATMTDGLPCDSSSVTQAVSLSATASLYGDDVSMGSATLASVSADTSSRALFDYRSSGASYCTSTSGDGCVHAQAKRGFGNTIGLGGIPSVIKNDKFGTGGTFGCGGYALQILNYVDTAQAESGVTVTAPTAGQSASSGTAQLKYATATGGCSTAQTINWGTTAPVVIFPTVSFTDSAFSGGTTTVSITPSLSFGLTSTSQTTSTCGTKTCTTAASAQVQSPVYGDLLYVITTGSTTVCDLDIHIDLGTLLSQTSYTGAPNAS